MKKILIMGLPGSGKTTLAKALEQSLIILGCSVKIFNADDVRAEFNDWDFSYEGRLRQAERMRSLADDMLVDFVIADFIAPVTAARELFSANYIIWVDTIRESRFADTDAMFEPPESFDIKVHYKEADHWAALITQNLTQQYLSKSFTPAYKFSTITL